MKKTLIVLLAFLLILALSSCGKDDAANGSSDIAGSADTGSAADSGTSADMGGSTDIVTPVAWPTTGFPAGFPEYADGTVTAVEDYVEGASARISGTNEAAIAAYINTLEGAGWAVYAAEGNAEGTTLMQEKDENTYLIAYIGRVNDNSGDFVISVNEQRVTTQTGTGTDTAGTETDN